VGAGNEQRGKAFVVYEDIYDAKSALEHLNGFNVCGRYLVVLYYQPEKQQRRMDLEKQRREVEELRKVRVGGVGWIWLVLVCGVIYRGIVRLVRFCIATHDMTRHDTGIRGGQGQGG
jgi:RNA recognition motif-containing protein